MQEPGRARVLYGVEERPASLWESLLYGWQHTLVDISPFVLPLGLAAALGFGDLETAQLISFGLVGMGLATLMQTTIGNRLPIIQGPSATLTGSIIPVASQMGPAAMWGAVFAGGLIEAALGASRALSLLRRYFPPLVSGVVITVIGLSLAQLAARLTLGDGSASNFAFAGGVLALILLLQFGLKGHGILSRGAIFFSIWMVGLGVGTLTGSVSWDLVAQQPWFQAPILFPYGFPGGGWEFTLAAVLAVMAGYLGSIMESVGDYAATCRVAAQRLTSRHINRGIFSEGLGCAAVSLIGGMPCTSYTQNIGIIAATGVASRHVVRIAALFLMAYGLCPKFGALLVAIPRPVLGGVFLLVCAQIVISGITLLKDSLQTPAQGLAAGLSLVISLSLPLYASAGPAAGALQTAPLLFRLTLTNPVVLAVVLAITLNLLLTQDEGADR
ncbi:MAG TPA: solute carrier family 23 protein [Acidobacteriota bacterium]|nr:solute carrier family 23 protein [Acidobacteriota bacterium]